MSHKIEVEIKEVSEFSTVSNLTVMVEVTGRRLDSRAIDRARELLTQVSRDMSQREAEGTPEEDPEEE